MIIVHTAHHRLSSEVVRLHILFLFHDAQVAVDLVDITRDLNKTSITARLIYKTDQLWVPHILCVNVDHTVVVHHLGEDQVHHRVSIKQRQCCPTITSISSAATDMSIFSATFSIFLGAGTRFSLRTLRKW